MKNFIQSKKAQMAVEYMILLMVVVSLVLIGFPKYIPQSQNAANVYFDRLAVGIMGEGNPCGDGCCDSDWETTKRCPLDCSGSGVIDCP